jgi:hypothetical protein
MVFGKAFVDGAAVDRVDDGLFVKSEGNAPGNAALKLVDAAIGSCGEQV